MSYNGKKKFDILLYCVFLIYLLNLAKRRKHFPRVTQMLLMRLRTNEFLKSVCHHLKLWKRHTFLPKCEIHFLFFILQYFKDLQ